MCDRSHLVGERRIKELRQLKSALFDELDAIRAGKSNLANQKQLAERLRVEKSESY